MGASCCKTVIFRFSIGRLPLFLPQFVLSSCFWAGLHVPCPFHFVLLLIPPPLNDPPSRLPLRLLPAFLVYLQCECVRESPAHCGSSDAVALQRDERSVMQSDRQHSCSPGSLTSRTAAKLHAHQMLKCSLGTTRVWPAFSQALMHFSQGGGRLCAENWIVNGSGSSLVHKLNKSCRI